MTSRRFLLAGLSNAAFLGILARSGEVSAAQGALPSGNEFASGEAAEPMAISLPNTESFDMRSANGRDYRIMVSWPARALFPEPAKFQTVFLLDANEYFPSVAELARYFSYARECPPVVVVGIGYPVSQMADTVKLRLTDYTWVVDERHEALVSKIAGGSESVASGGGEAFLRFVDEELKPAIAARFPADVEDATLFGHSLGGLFAVETLFTKPESFSRYSISSPPILWADDDVIRREAAYARANDRLEARVLFAAGSEETSLEHVLGFPEELSEVEREFVASVHSPNPLQQLRAFHRKIAARRYKGLALDLQIFAGESHTSVANVVFARALRTLFASARPT